MADACGGAQKQMIRFQFSICNEFECDTSSVRVSQQIKLRTSYFLAHRSFSGGGDLRTYPIEYPVCIIIRRPRFWRVGFIAKAGEIGREDLNRGIFEGFTEFREGLFLAAPSMQT